MNDNKYMWAGYAAFVAAAMVLPLIALGIGVDIVAQKGGSMAVALLLPYLAVGILQVVCNLYAFGRFKTFLNERLDFHATDRLMVVIIVGVALLTSLAFGGKVANVLASLPRVGLIAFVALIGLLGLVLGVLSIVFAIRLFRLPSDLNGLLRPYCYVTIASAICFVTLLLAPIGLLLDAVGNVMLGVILLRPAQATMEAEFV